MIARNAGISMHPTGANFSYGSDVRIRLWRFNLAHRTKQLFIPVLVACNAIMFTAVDSHAQSKSTNEVAASSPRKLVGLHTNSAFYPYGWKYRGPPPFHSPTHSQVMLKRGNRHALLLERKLPRTSQLVEAVVTDAIEIDDPNDPLRVAHICYFEGSEADASRPSIIAEVRFARHCDMKTKLVTRAWRINLESEKFEPLSSTRGLICEYGTVSRGGFDFREQCPTYNFRF